jgi:hypothetical protein
MNNIQCRDISDKLSQQIIISTIMMYRLFSPSFSSYPPFDL